jgi:predicted  nucleic acid-binding Zn-ribbon protein
MSDTSSAVKNLRERLTGAGEDRLGKALTELLDNPLLIGTIERASTAREKAAQAQELAMGAFNIPSAADIERLTRRLRSVSQRLEGIEDGMQRLDRALASRGIDSSQIGERLSKIEQQLGVLATRLSERAAQSSAASGAAAGTSKTSPSRKASASRKPKAGSPSRRKAATKKS